MKQSPKCFKYFSPIEMLDIQMHVQLIEHQHRMKGTESSTSAGLSSFTPIVQKVDKAKPAPARTQPAAQPSRPKQLTSRDLWNFNEFDEDLDARLGALVGDDVEEEELEQKEDDSQFDFDDEGDDSEVYFSDDNEYEMMYSSPDKWNSPKDILQLNSGADHFFTDELRE